jgi:ABC-2 type transport system permease protein
MDRVIDITLKDLSQLTRDRKTFLFLLFMPLVFTLLFGYAFGGFNSNADSRLSVGYLDEDKSAASSKLRDLLAASEVIRLDERPWLDRAGMEALVADDGLPAVIIVPKDYGRTLLHGKRAQLELIGDTSSSAGMLIKSELLSRALRLENAVRTAILFEKTDSKKTPYKYILREALAKWQQPPISVAETTSSLISKQDGRMGALAHTSPGMMLQFAIASLLTSAQILVTERRTHALQRLMTTATSRPQILLGHFLAIFTLIFAQFVLLTSFGQFVLRVNYLYNPAAVMLVNFTAALCIGAMGLLIGIIAKSEEQAIIFSMILMFINAGLGGAWMDLEVTSSAFQAVGHLTPVAWAMDGYKNISIRGLGFTSVLLPSAALLGYAALFFALAVWRFRKE